MIPDGVFFAVFSYPPACRDGGEKTIAHVWCGAASQNRMRFCRNAGFVFLKFPVDTDTIPRYDSKVADSKRRRREWLSGGAPPCQGGGRGFDPRLALDRRRMRVHPPFFVMCFS